LSNFSKGSTISIVCDSKIVQKVVVVGCVVYKEFTNFTFNNINKFRNDLSKYLLENSFLISKTNLEKYSQQCDVGKDEASRTNYDFDSCTTKIKS